MRSCAPRRLLGKARRTDLPPIALAAYGFTVSRLSPGARGASCEEIDDGLRRAASRVRQPARQAERRTVRLHLAGHDLHGCRRAVCEQRDARVVWLLAGLTPAQQECVHRAP